MHYYLKFKLDAKKQPNCDFFSRILGPIGLANFELTRHEKYRLSKIEFKRIEK